VYERTIFISFSSCALEAGKEFLNLVVGEEGHVNSPYHTADPYSLCGPLTAHFT